MKKVLVLLVLFMSVLPSVQAKTHQVENKALIIQKDAGQPSFVDILGLSEAQKTEYKNIRREEYAHLNSVVKKIKEKHEELEKIMEEEISAYEYELRLNKIKDELKTYHLQVKMIRLENEEKIEAMLTPQQKKLYEEIKQKSRDTIVTKKSPIEIGESETTKNVIIRPCKQKDGTKACTVEDLIKKNKK